MFNACLRVIAHRRAQRFGPGALFAQEENPRPSMSAMIDLKKERRLVGTRATRYQSGGALNCEETIFKTRGAHGARAAEKKVSETQCAGCALTRFSCTLRD